MNIKPTNISEEEKTRIFEESSKNQTPYVEKEPVKIRPVKRGMWITKAEDYYKKWQNSGRSWDDMPYFVTGEHIACSECFTEYDVCTEGIEHWIGCPCCLARMDGDSE